MVADSHADGPWWVARLRRVTSARRAYFPEIDGLRFVAIASVLVFHVWYAAGGALAGNYAAEAESRSWLFHMSHGARGVELFFAISGFILGLPFAKHHLGAGKPVRLKKYFVRRVTRLEPPYVIALVGIYAAAFFLRMPDSQAADFWESFWLRLVYGYTTFHQHYPSLNGVTWSLEIEVQFYLIAPILAMLFRLPTIFRRLALVALIVISPWIAMLVPVLHFTVVGYASYFLIGFLVADLQVTRPIDSESSRKGMMDLAGVLGLLGMAVLPGSKWIDFTLPWCIALVVLGGMRGGLMKRMLSVPLLTVIGGMCYSIYLIHYPLMSFLAEKLSLSGLSSWEASLRLGVVALPIVLVVGTVFYVLIERPCMVPDWPSRLSRKLGFGSAAERA